MKPSERINQIYGLATMNNIMANDIVLIRADIEAIKQYLDEQYEMEENKKNGST